MMPACHSSHYICSLSWLLSKRASLEGFLFHLVVSIYALIIHLSHDFSAYFMYFIMKSSCHLPTSPVFLFGEWLNCRPNSTLHWRNSERHRKMGDCWARLLTPVSEFRWMKRCEFSFLFVHGSKNQNQHYSYPSYVSNFFLH